MVEQQDIYEQNYNQMLRPMVRIRAAAVGGSGTVLYSQKDQKGRFSTYILTNQHVVNGLITVEKKWSSLLGRDIKKDIFGIPEIHFFEYEWESRVIGARAIEADIMTYDKDEDLALLKLRAGFEAPAVAKMYPREEEYKLRLTMPVYALGSGLGENPVVTGGFLSSFNREIDNKEYYLQTAPTIFGNSGGAVFLAATREFIGVPARIAVVMRGFGTDAITHLSYCIPITRIYKFLEDQLFRFIYDSNYTEEEEAIRRDRKRRDEELKIAAKEGRGEEPEEEEPKEEEG